MVSSPLYSPVDGAVNWGGEESTSIKKKKEPLEIIFCLSLSASLCFKTAPPFCSYQVPLLREQSLFLSDSLRTLSARPHAN